MEWVTSGEWWLALLAQLQVQLQAQLQLSLKAAAEYLVLDSESIKLLRVMIRNWSPRILIEKRC
jgi:hypothetical protein